VSNALKSIFFRTRSTAVPNLSPADKQIISIVRQKRRPVTAKEIIEASGLKRRNVYARLQTLQAKGLFKTDGIGYVYTGPKPELKVTPFMAIMSIVGSLYAYGANNPAVMFFALLSFTISYLVEK